MIFNQSRNGSRILVNRNGAFEGRRTSITHLLSHGGSVWGLFHGLSYVVWFNREYIRRWALIVLKGISVELPR